MKAKSWIAPTITLLVAIILGATVFKLPDSYLDHHSWPPIAALTSVVFAIWGGGHLFWCVIPASKVPEVLLCLGGALMLFCWLMISSICGVIVSGVVTLMGFGLLMYQHTRS